MSADVRRDSANETRHPSARSTARLRRDLGFVGRAPLFAMLVLLGACDWFTDFRDQPKIEPWEVEFTARDSAGKIVVDERVPFRGNPQMSVPMTGSALPAFIVSYGRTPATIDSMAGLANPQPITPASLENGRKYYQINCTVCHGPAGMGNGPAVRFGVAAPSLLGPPTRARSDGYLWGIIRNGRGLMPSYNRIEEMDRWDVVNYVRALQGMGGAAADTTQAGYPGANGAHVPGPTRTAPTRPVPHNVYGPDVMPRGTASSDTGATTGGAHE